MLPLLLRSKEPTTATQGCFVSIYIFKEREFCSFHRNVWLCFVLKDSVQTLYFQIIIRKWRFDVATTFALNQPHATHSFNKCIEVFLSCIIKLYFTKGSMKEAVFIFFPCCLTWCVVSAGSSKLAPRVPHISTGARTRQWWWLWSMTTSSALWNIRPTNPNKKAFFRP